MEIKIERTPTSVDVRLGVIRRAAASATFQRSPRLRELLTYICERALENRVQDLREQVIGCVVFGRKADYSPGDDNIVRVEVRQLRKRLDEYFGSEGKNEPFTIAIPKGAYIPVFEPRDSKTPEPPQATAAVAVAVGSSPLEQARVLPVESSSITHPSVLHPSVLPSTVVSPIVPSSRVWRRWALAATAVAVALAVYCSWLLAGNQLIARPATVDRTALWPYLFNAHQETTIACADSTLVVAEGVLNRSVTLDEYISRDYLKSEDATIGRLLQQVPNWQFTDLADVRLVQRLFRLNAEHWDKVVIRSAKTMQIHDFTRGNTILLGSNRSNLWNRMFEPMLNFRFDYDQDQRVAFVRNMKPLAGEQSTYRAALPGKSGDCYSVVALVPNLRRTGNVLMVGGTTAEGTESAGEFLINAASSSGLLATLTERNKGKLPYFEALLRSGTFSGIAKNAEIIAFRIIPVEPPRN